MPKETVSYTIENITKDLWEKFKAKLTKDKNLSEHFIELIKNKVDEA